MPSSRYSGHQDREVTAFKPSVIHTLPVHPPPYPLESMTSYLLRITRLNLIDKSIGMRDLCFPGQRLRITSMTDFPPASITGLALATAQNDERLLQTTFYHIGRKLNRATNSQALSKFMTGTLGESLRYCSTCLAEQDAHHSLLWRFSEVTGCPVHGCKLFDACWHCGKRIPFFATGQRIRICPSCHGDLCAGPMVPLEIGELTRLERLADDWAYLLMPQPWEYDSDDIAWMFGQYLADRRRAAGLYQEKLAEQINVPMPHIRAIEGQKKNNGASFLTYLRYVRYFDLTFKHIFSEVLLTRHYYEGDFLQRREQQLTTAAKQAIEYFIAENREISSRTIAEHIGISRATLWRYPCIWNLVAQARKGQVAAGQAQKDESQMDPPAHYPMTHSG